MLQKLAEPTLLYHQVNAYSDMCLLVAIRLSTIHDQKQRIAWASKFIKEVNEAQQLTVQLSLTSELKRTTNCFECLNTFSA